MNGQKRKIVITGVTRGLGRAMAEEFVRRGHWVAGCGRSAFEIERMKSLVKAHLSVVDVTSDSRVKEWAKSVLAEIGAPDLVLNNAALINRSASLWELSAEE